MVARSFLVVGWLAIGCAREPLERLPPPVNELALAPLPPAPPPPPPPPPRVEDTTVEMPDELSDVISRYSAPPAVTVVELTEGKAHGVFLGYGIVRTKPLTEMHAKELVDKLAADSAFIDGGDYGCVGDPIGLRFARGSILRDVVVDCGHMYLTPSRHDGRFALLAPAVNQFIYALR